MGLILLPAQMYQAYILVLLLFGIAFRLELWQNLRSIIGYLLFLIVLCVVINFLFLNTSVKELFFNSLKIFTIITISILLVSDLNIMEMIAFLKKLGIPQKIAIAIGVGFRYASLFVDDLKRINFIQTMNGYGLNASSFKRHGILNSLGIFSLPVFLSMLNRTDKISMSILMQDIENRATFYKFKRINLSEAILLALGLGLLLLWGITQFIPFDESIR